MNKNYVLSFFLINLFVISNVYPTIVRTVVLKHKITGQQITLYGDIHWGIAGGGGVKLDAAQFAYISQLLEKNKESLAQKFVLFHEGEADKGSDGLLLNIIRSPRNDWKELIYSIECRNMRFEILREIEECGINIIIPQLESLFRKILTCLTNTKTSKFFNEALGKGLYKIWNFTRWILFNKNRNLTDFKILLDRFMTRDFFDLNALCEISCCEKPFIALFAGARHIINLKDMLVNDCNYEVEYDSGFLLYGKYCQNYDNIDATKLSPIENTDFDRMLSVFNGDNIGA